MTGQDGRDPAIRVLRARPDLLDAPPAGTHEHILRRASHRRARTTLTTAASVVAVGAIAVAVPLTVAASNDRGGQQFANSGPGDSAPASSSAAPASSRNPVLPPPLTSVPADAVAVAGPAPEGVVGWTSVAGCAPGVPGGATDMRSTVADGLPTQQVVSFPEVEEAIAEAERVAEVYRVCSTESETLSVGGVDVGTQGLIVTDGSAGSLVLIRRGNALTLVGAGSGSDTADSDAADSEVQATDLARTAFDVLCVFDRTYPCGS